MRRRASFWAFLFALIFLFFPSTVQAAPPANFQTTLIAGSGFSGATTFSFSPDGRIFILERTGKVKIVKNGQVLATPFADLPSAGTGDRGLIGIAFDPDYLNNHWVYFWYTSSGDLHNRLVRFNASGDVGTDGPVVLFETTTPSQELHVGGGMSFGPDGKIYLGVGDNGYPPNAQDVSVPFGKILRINKDGSAPGDNPFVNTPGALPQVYAMGVRNPWRLQFDAASGRIFVGDVGNDAWEEVNKIDKGKNYGWPIVEGNCTLVASECSKYVNPIYAYPHNGDSSAVTGGPVYHGSMFPAIYKGRYFVGDYAQGFIRTLTLDANGNVTKAEDFDTNAGSVVDMREAFDGSLYYITYFPARLYRVSYSTGNTVPIANASVDKTKGIEPLTVNFSSQGSSDPDGTPLTYNWNFGDGTNSTAANPQKTYTVKGTYTVTLHVSDGTNTSEAIPLVIQVGTPPSVHIGAPTDGATYKAGDTIFYTASGIDGAGFDLNDADFTTEVLLHHDTHTHPFLGPIQSKTGTFTIPTTGEASPNTWLEIRVTGRDPNGLADTEIVNIYPQKSNITLASDPAGLSVNLDGTPVASLPVTLQGVIGFQRELNAPVNQFVNGKSYVFDHWSDAGLPKHFVTMAQNATSYTAYYKEVPLFKGEYFNNINLTGTPAKTRNDGVIDFDWEGGSPMSGINTDKFSVRWTRNQYFPAGKYTFTITSDDGMRLFIDGKSVVDAWFDQGATDHTGTVDLTAGNHDVRVEYYENTGEASAKLDWSFIPSAIQPTPTPTASPTATPTLAPSPTATPADNGFTGQYYNLPGTGTAPVLPTGTPNFTRQDATVDFNWGYASPNAPITADHFGVRWTKTQNFAGGNYIFNTVSDDGVRLYIDNQLVINQWNDHGETKHTAQKTLTAGNHDIKVEFYDNTEDAIISMWWDPINQPTPSATASPTVAPTTSPTATPGPVTAFNGEYWSVPDAGSKPAMPTRVADFTRTENTVNFDWGQGSPGGTIPVDHFIARWTKTDAFTAGTYRFSTTSDDGVRLYIDNTLILDQWNDHAPTTHTADAVLNAGNHTLRYEFYENTGGAVAKLGWTVISGTPAPTATPTPTVAPTSTPTPPTGGYTGEYWNTIGTGRSPLFPTRAPDLTRNDAAINFDFGSGSPAASIDTEHFVARWTRKETFTAGTYTFTTESDDGVRVYIDGQLIIDDWNDHAVKVNTATKAMTAGDHDIKVEYYEDGGGSIAKFFFSK